MFARLLGQSTISLSASTEVVWGIKKLNLALVLDNTGSMAQSGKMTELKTAAHNLLTTLKNAAKIAGRRQGLDRAVRHRRQCRHRQRRRHLDRLDRLGRGQRHLQQQQLQHKELLPIARQDLDSRSAQHLERLRQRPRPEQRRDATPRRSPGAPATLFRAHQAANCPAAMMPLCDDWTALNAKIDADDPDRQHQRHHRSGLGLPDAVAGRAVQRAGAGARSRQGHHPADRRRRTPRTAGARPHPRSTPAPARPATTSRPPTSSSTPCA